MKERVDILLKKASKPGTVISSWEQGFLESVQRQLSGARRGGAALSPKQVDIVHRVEAKVEKALKGDPQWEASWNEEKAWAWKIACNYYDESRPRYYGNIVDRAKANPDKIPSSRDYKKVVENKYAQKIISALKEEPKYLAGSTVMLRSTARQSLPYREWHGFKNVPLFVIEPTARAISAAAGCRIYLLLSSTSASTVEVEERYIKKWKAPKSTKKTGTYPEKPSVVLF
tara:strand:- start:2490 stop:3176 length:687 start_codon:yes stop_codon:yes gene_type:complete